MLIAMIAGVCGTHCTIDVLLFQKFFFFLFPSKYIRIFFFHYRQCEIFCQHDEYAPLCNERQIVTGRA